MIRLYWMLMDMCLPKFDIYLGTVAPNCFKSRANSGCPDFFFKKISSDDRSESLLVRRNIVSSGQSVWALNKFTFRHALQYLTKM